MNDPYTLPTTGRTFYNPEAGVSATVRRRNDERYAVTVTDTDSGRMLPMVKVFDAEADAVAYAERCAE